MICSCVSSRYDFSVFVYLRLFCFFFFSSRRRHTRCLSDWSSDVCSSDLGFGGSTYSWRLVMPRLAESFRVVAVDLNGFGYTQRLAGPAHYTREAQGEQIGRASCRERAGISVVGEWYEKKKKAEGANGMTR